jgi:hypothetical protein
MTPEVLLIPRYKCIAPIPFQPFPDMYNVDDIFTDNGKTAVLNQHGDPVCVVEWEKYPHLFQPLPWWSDRKVEEMPEFVRCIKTPDQIIQPGEVLKVNWHRTGEGKVENGQWVFCYTNCYEPATLAEYEQWKQSNK